MIVVLRKNPSDQLVEHVCDRIRKLGQTPHVSRGEFRTIIGVIGEEGLVQAEQLRQIEGVDDVLNIMTPFKLASRDFQKEDTVLDVRGVKVGGQYFTPIAGPCAVENEKQTLEIARGVRAGGAVMLRGGAFKPRTSPYSFQGLGEEGLKILRACGDELNMPVITEVVDPRDVPLIERYADVFQIGARNMQNYPLLSEVGQTRKAVFLKRGLCAPVQEWILAAEYVLAGGNKDVMLCERGLKTFVTETRFTLDIGCIPVVQKLSHLPILADPSHAAGKRELVPSLAYAAVAAGAHGLMIECHSCPEEALCDGAQALNPKDYAAVNAKCCAIAELLGKTVVKPLTKLGK